MSSPRSTCTDIMACNANVWLSHCYLIVFGCWHHLPSSGSVPGLTQASRSVHAQDCRISEGTWEQLEPPCAPGNLPLPITRASSTCSKIKLVLKSWKEKVSPGSYVRSQNCQSSHTGVVLALSFSLETFRGTDKPPWKGQSLTWQSGSVGRFGVEILLVLFLLSFVLLGHSEQVA